MLLLDTDPKSPKTKKPTPKNTGELQKLIAAAKFPEVTPDMERKYDIEQNFEQCMDVFNKKKLV